MPSPLFSYLAGNAAAHHLPNPGRPPGPPVSGGSPPPSESRQILEAVGDSALLSVDAPRSAAKPQAGAVFSPEQARTLLEATQRLILQQAPAAARAHADLHLQLFSELA